MAPTLSASPPASYQGATLAPRAPQDHADGCKACHEAAHAVVAVRLGLPLLAIVADGHRVYCKQGDLTDSVAYAWTELDAGATRRWLSDPGDPENRARLIDCAAMMMAGVESDLKHGLPEGDASHSDDLLSVAKCAVDLGLAQRIADERVVVFQRAAAVTAAREMGRDGGLAWQALSKELAKRLRMTGDEVREFMASLNSPPGTF